MEVGKNRKCAGMGDFRWLRKKGDRKGWGGECDTWFWGNNKERERTRRRIFYG